MTPLFLFVRPPRPLWPFNGSSTAFWPPLAFASMAAALREQVPGLRVAILDAPAMSMGWKTLTATMRSLSPQYVAIGEEAVSCVEGFRLARLAKELGARVIAGGCFFSHVAAEVLATGLVDVVVRGEGELTIVELMRALPDGKPNALRSVAGISFRDREETIFTGHRELLPDLDNLPFPAYDLLPIGQYGSASTHHPQFASIESSRGCSHGCQFCVLWRQMGRFNSNRHQPALRVKSPERLIEEIRILMDRYHRRYLGWVDPCFNADPNTALSLSELLLRENRRIGQSAWLRADCLLRDDDSGALKVWSDAGWNEAYIGIERLDARELAVLGKGNLHHEVECVLQMLHQEYRRVTTFGSLIYGVPGDTPQKVRALFRAAEQLPIDQLFFIPFTPLPGTPAWKPRMWDETGKWFRGFDFISGLEHETAGLSATIARSYLFDWSVDRLERMLWGMFNSDRRRREICWNLVLRSLPLMLSSALSVRTRSAGAMRFPTWYES